MSSPLFPAPDAARASEKQRWLDTAAREHATTLRVLQAFPDDQLHLKPSERGMSAGELAFLFSREQMLLVRALTTGFDWSAPPPPPQAAPDSLEEIVTALKGAHERVMALVRETPDERIESDAVQFFTAPMTMGEVPLIHFMWMVLFDQIHHRGQMTVYLRMAGGRVPSIYGPSGDESWM